MNREEVHSVLWDIKREKISSLPKSFVVERSLTYGTIGLIIKTIKTHGLPYVQEVFHSMKSTAFVERKYQYLKEYLLK